MAVPTLEEILAVGPGNYLNVGGTIYQPVYSESGSGETLEIGGPIGVMTYKLGAGPGEAYNYTNLNTGVTQRNEFTESRGFFGDLFSDVKSVAQDVAPIAAAALTMGGAGGLLGSALTGGSLSATASSALGNALIAGASGALTGQDPLKAALLAAGGTYAGGLFGDAATVSDAQFIAADAAQLASQGLGVDQIEEVLRASGVNAAAAIGAADAATSGLSVPEIAQEISAGSRGGLFTDTMAGPPAPTTVTTAPSGLQTVTTTAAAPTVNAGGLLAAIPSAVSPGGNIVSTTMAPLDQPSQITVTGERAPEYNVNDLLASIPPSLIGPDVGPQPQVIEVPGTKAPTVTQDDLAAAIAATVNPIVASTVTPPTTTADQVIEVPGTKQPTQQTIGDVAAAVNAGTLYGPGMTGTQTTVYDKTLEATGSKTAADTAATAAGLLGGLTLTDLLKALTTMSSLGMLGGGGTGGGGGGGTTTTAPTTPVPVGNADYYKSIQQYYNTYMPQTPRDVATPLQQWYEGKFGG